MTNNSSSMLARYRKADGLVSPALHAAMLNRTVEPMWSDDGSFIYRRQTGCETHEFVEVVPERQTRQAAFDHQRMAASLSQLLEAKIDPARLPVSYVRRTGSGLQLALADGRSAVADADYRIELATGPGGTLQSPSKRKELFRREHDLWIRDISGRDEQALTTDGQQWFAWGKGPDVNYVHIPLKRLDPPLPPALAVFSPTGRYVFAIRLDERGYVDFPFYEGLPEGGGIPIVHTIKTHMQNAKPVTTHEGRVFDLENGTSHPVTLSERQILSLTRVNLSVVAWSADERRFWFHTTDGRLIAVHWGNDKQHEIYADEDPVWEDNTFIYRQPLVRILPASNEFIWFSMEDGWGHLYLHDLSNGRRKHRITEGPIVVGDIQRVDESRREILFVATCGSNGHNPHWRKLYRAQLDGGQQQLLTPEPVDHEMPLTVIDYYKLIFHREQPTISALSPNGDFFVDHMSTVAMPPRIVLRARDGAIVMDLEQTDIRGLLELGYQLPDQFHIRSEDGRADIWGVVSMPASPLDPGAIPVVELIYAGYQVTWQPTGFLGPEQGAAAFGAAATFNALGFAVVTLDGRGTPGRDREFRRWIVGHGATQRGLEDHVWFIRSLKSAYPALDLDRVGVAGGSFGGYNATKAMLQFPDFYKVGISNAGVHHPPFSQYGQWRWHLGQDYDVSAPELLDWSNVPLASRLKGRMLIMIGNLDENVAINHSFVLIRELMRFGKRFDLKLWPDTNHYGATPYVRMIYWDYFVEHLLGQQPPDDYVPPGTEIGEIASLG